jgi:hypothetical protein
MAPARSGWPPLAHLGITPGDPPRRPWLKALGACSGFLRKCGKREKRKKGYKKAAQRPAFESKQVVEANQVIEKVTSALGMPHDQDDGRWRWQEARKERQVSCSYSWASPW